MRLTVNNPSILKGKVNVSGSKNAAIPIICTSIINKGRVILSNIPRITDVFILLKILRMLNCKSTFIGNVLIIDSSKIKYASLNNDEVRKIRGSYYLIGPLLYLFNKCEIAIPGGCVIGERPIDAHIHMLENFGNEVDIKENVLNVKRNKYINKIEYELTKESVGASINALICSIMFENIILKNLVIEPEGEDVINFITKLGIDIIHNKTECIIYNRMSFNKNITYKIIPDRIEAITFILMGVLTGDLIINKSNIMHYQLPLNQLINAGCEIKIKKSKVYVKKTRCKAFDIVTGIYPGFPTDMQPLFAVLLSVSKGKCEITENIFENRMQIFEDIRNSDACVNVVNNKVYMIGVDILKYNNYLAKDLRHAAALMLLVLTFGGSVECVEILNRGYQDFKKKIRKLGAEFNIVED